MRRREAEERRIKGLPTVDDAPQPELPPAPEDDAPPSREGMVAFLMQNLGCTREVAEKEYDWMLANHNAGKSERD